MLNMILLLQEQTLEGKVQYKNNKCVITTFSCVGELINAGT